MSSFRVLQLKRRHFGPFWYKTMSFWPFLVQNDVVLDARTVFFLTAEQSKTTSFWTVAVQNDVVLKLF